MRTATADTRRRLEAAIDGSQRAWALAHDVSPADVSDCLRDRPMSAKRENRLRAALGMEQLKWQVVELMENQRVVTNNYAWAKTARNRHVMAV